MASASSQQGGERSSQAGGEVDVGVPGLGWPPGRRASWRGGARGRRRRALASSESQCSWTSPEAEGGLGAGDVQDDQVVDRFGCRRMRRDRRRSGRRPGLAVRAGLGLSPVRRACEIGRADAELRAGPDPRRGRGELVAAGVDPAGVEDTRVLPELLGRVGETSSGGCHGRRPRNRPAPAGSSPRKRGRARHEARPVGQPPGHGGQAQRDRRAHSAERTDQPKSDAATSHVRGDLSSRDGPGYTRRGGSEMDRQPSRGGAGTIASRLATARRRARVTQPNYGLVRPILQPAPRTRPLKRSGGTASKSAVRRIFRGFRIRAGSSRSRCWWRSCTALSWV